MDRRLETLERYKAATTARFMVMVTYTPQILLCPTLETRGRCIWGVACAGAKTHGMTGAHTAWFKERDIFMLAADSYAEAVDWQVTARTFVDG